MVGHDSCLYGKAREGIEIAIVAEALKTSLLFENYSILVYVFKSHNAVGDPSTPAVAVPLPPPHSSVQQTREKMWYRPLQPFVHHCLQYGSLIDQPLQTSVSRRSRGRGTEH